MKLFHVSWDHYPIGRIIEPGNYGRLAREYMRGVEVPAFFTPALLWEVALETARLVCAPQAPSRLACVFTWCTLEDAFAFRDQYHPGDQVFSVRPLIDSPRIYKGSFGLIKNKESSYVDYMTCDAIRYWTEEPSSPIEALIECPVVITERICG